MSEKFEQLKKAKANERLLKGLTFSFSFGIFAAGLSILLLKLSKIQSFWLYGIGIGVLAAAAFLVLWQIIGRKSDKDIAKQLDERHGLQEKVQTAVEFQDAEGVIVQLQRQQTDRALAELPAEPPFYKRYWKNAVAFFLALAMFLTGVLIPYKTETPPVTPSPNPNVQKFEFSTWMQNALREVINDVTNSKMSETPKAQTTSGLENLYETLQTVELRSEMQELVVSVIVHTDEYVKAANTYKQICVALDKSEMQAVRKFAVALLPMSAENFSSSLAEEMQNVWNMGTLSSELLLFAPEVALCLRDVQPADDPLLTSIKAYADTFLTLAEELQQGSFSGEQKTEKLNALYENSATYLQGSITEQSENRSICQYVRNRLTDIFRIDEDAVPELSVDSEPSIGKKREEEDEVPGGSIGGGAGDGEHLYGGSDKIYDPEEGQVPYGEVFDKYKAEIEKLYDRLSEEEREIISEYFSKLSNGAKQDDTTTP